MGALYLALGILTSLYGAALAYNDTVINILMLEGLKMCMLHLRKVHF